MLLSNFQTKWYPETKPGEEGQNPEDDITSADESDNESLNDSNKKNKSVEEEGEEEEEEEEEVEDDAKKEGEEKVGSSSGTAHNNDPKPPTMEPQNMEHDNTQANSMNVSTLTATGAAAGKENPVVQNQDYYSRNAVPIVSKQQQQQKPLVYTDYDGTIYRGPEVKSGDLVPSSWENHFLRITQQHVWPFIKFFIGPSDLDYGGVAYDIVSDNSDLMRTEAQCKQIWNDHKVRLWVEKGLVMKRNNVNGSICRQYKGTCCCSECQL